MYRITKQQCQDNIKGICCQCGGILEPIETVDNSDNPTFWSGCLKCSRFDNGVEPKIYAIAKELVEDCNYKRYTYSDMLIKDGDSEDVKQYKTECQISGACDIVHDVLRIYKKHTATIEEKP